MQRWEPDDQLVDAIRTGRCSQTYSDLSRPDRAWVVAGLTQAGLTSEHIAELLACSLRTVHVVKTDPLTAVCLTYMAEAEAFHRELRLLRSELTRMTADRDHAALSASRLRSTLARITAERSKLCGKGLHEMTAYNTYTAPSGNRFCRECNRLRAAQYRARRKVSA